VCRLRVVHQLPYVTAAASGSAPHARWHRCSYGVWTGNECTYLGQFSFGSLKTAVLPIKFGTAPPAFTQGFGSEADFARIPGSRLINQAYVPTGISANYFVSTCRSVKANLFRIYLLQ